MTLPRRGSNAKSMQNLSSMFRRFSSQAIGCCLIAGFLFVSASTADATTNDQIIQAFAETSDGYSSDELVITDSLRKKFLAAVSNGQTMSADEERDALLNLLRLRKTGKLTVRATRRGKNPDSSITPIAEIAIRVVSDRHRETTDTILADPAFAERAAT